MSVSMKSRGKELVGMRGGSGTAQLQNAASSPLLPSLHPCLSLAALPASLTLSERRGKEGAK